MLPNFKRTASIGIASGLAIQFVAQAIYGGESPSVSFILLLAGSVVFIFGCSQFAKARGYSPWLGVFGLLSFFGLIALVVLFPDRHQQGSPTNSSTPPKEFSEYPKFVRLVALSPLLPLSLFMLISVSCSIFGFGLGFGCAHPGYGKTYWPEIFAYFGILGWIPSLLAAALLKMFSIGARL